MIYCCLASTITKWMSFWPWATIVWQSVQFTCYLTPWNLSTPFEPFLILSVLELIGWFYTNDVTACLIEFSGIQRLKLYFCLIFGLLKQSAVCSILLSGLMDCRICKHSHLTYNPTSGSISRIHISVFPPVCCTLHTYVRHFLLYHICSNNIKH